MTELELFKAVTEGGVLVLIAFLAKLYAPSFTALAEGVKALPAALKELTEAMQGLGKEVKDGLGDVKEELAVIKDRQGRPEEAAVLMELIERRRARVQAQTKAAQSGD